MIRATCDHTSPRTDGICAECLPAPKRDSRWRPHRPGEIVHKVTNYATIAPCGATEREGARFTSTFRLVTCKGCREITKLRRDAAKARMLRDFGS